MAEKLINPFAEGVPSRGFVPPRPQKREETLPPPTPEEWEEHVEKTGNVPVFFDAYDDDEIADED